jgi:short-subunit dehydrogenase
MVKVIVVTGAGSGVGMELVFQLATAGQIVYALSRSDDKTLRLEEELIKRNLRNVVSVIQCDINNTSDISALSDKLKLDNRRVDVLVNSAGMLVNKPFEELTHEDWISVYQTNVFGVVNVVKALFPLLKRVDGEEKSRVINISSMGGVQGSAKFAGLSAYSSSKAALCGLSECLAEEFRHEGIQVNALALGSVETEMFKEAFPGYKAATTPEKMAAFIMEFAMRSGELFNGKIIPVSNSTP